MTNVMNIVTEDYVSFEIAKLLKEKGFNEGCRYYYPDSHTQLISYMDCKQSDMFGPEACIAPTQSMAMKWLREVHNIFIVIEPHMYDYINEKNSSYVFAIWEGDNYIEIYSSKNSGLRGISYSTYEQAVEAALKYSLKNLI